MPQLHHLIQNSEALEALQTFAVSHPESVNELDDRGRLPLHVALITNRNVEVVRWLLEQYPEGVRVADCVGRLPLHSAAATNSNVEVVRCLLDLDTKSLMVADNRGWLPLHYAVAYNSNAEVVRCLVALRMEIDQYGPVLLYFPVAYYRGRFRWLLNQPLNGVRFADAESLRPYRCTDSFIISYLELVDLALYRHRENVAVTLAIATATKGYVERRLWMLKKHPEVVRLVDFADRLPLHYAAANNSNVEVIRWLLNEYQESVKVHDEYGCLPLHYAAAYASNVEIVRCLVEACQTSVRVADNRGWLPLHYAVANNENVEVVRYLLERFPKGVGVADRYGRLPLHVTSDAPRMFEVMLLLLGDGSLYFERSVSFMSPSVVAILRDEKRSDKVRLCEMVGKMVECLIANPHYATSLREIFDYNLGPYNLQKGFKGLSTPSRPTLNVHVCGEKLAGKTTLTSWLQQKLQQPTTWLDQVSAVFSPPKMAQLVGFEERTPGILIHQVDRAQDVQFVLHDYGGHEEFRKVYRQFLKVPRSIYVVVLPLVEKLSDTEHRPYSVEALATQYRQWLGQIHNALQGASSPPSKRIAVIAVLNTFRGIPNVVEMPNLEEIRTQLQQCQQESAFRSTFEFYPHVTADCRNEHDVLSVCLAIESCVAQLRTLPEVQTTTAPVSFPVVQYLRDSFDRSPMVSQFVEETEYHSVVRRRLLEGGYREEDDLPGSLDLLVRWWVTDSLRTRRILRLSLGAGKQDIIATSVDALSHLLFGKVLDNMRRRSVVVIRRAAVRNILRETVQERIDAAELLVEMGLFLPIVAYDGNSGQVDIQPRSATACKDDQFLVIGLIDKRMSVQDIQLPEFHAEKTRRVHRWYTLDRDKVTTWGPDFFVALFQCVLSLVPSCTGPLIFKDGISAMAEDGNRKTTYIVRPHRHESLGDGFEVIVDVSTDINSLEFQDIVRKDDVVWMGLQAINATCLRLVGDEGLLEYCVYPDPRSTLLPLLVEDVEQELTRAEAQGLIARFQLRKYLYGYFPLEQTTLQGVTVNLPQQLTTGKVTNDQLAAAIQLLHDNLERPATYMQSMYSQFSETIAHIVVKVSELHDAHESAATAAAATAMVDRGQLMAMESTLNNIFRAQLNLSRNMCDFPLLVFLKRIKKRSLRSMVSSMFTKRYRVCCMCPVCGNVEKPEAYELRVSKGKWHRYLLLALQGSMILAGVALKSAGVPNLVADTLYEATTKIVSKASKELGELVAAFQDDVTAFMAPYIEDIGASAAAAVTGPPSNATAGAVDTIGQQPLDRERRVKWEYIRAMKALFAESLRDPDAAGSGLAGIWSDNGDMAFVCADESRGCRDRFRREGRSCLKVVAVYGG